MLNRFAPLLAIATLALTNCATTTGPPLPQSPTIPAVQAIASYEFGDSRVPLTVVEDQVQDALNSDSEAQREIADDLAALLGTHATYAAKQFALRQLRLVATERHVPTIAPLLTDPELSHMARYALETIPGNRVDRALRNALATATADLRPGIQNTLDARDHM